VASTSSICSPQRSTGFSAVIGSWIIDIRVQRSATQPRRSGGEHIFTISRILPPVGQQGRRQPNPSSPARSRICRRRFTDRQDHLSGATGQIEFDTASVAHRSQGSAMVRPRMSSTGTLQAFALRGSSAIAQSVAERLTAARQQRRRYPVEMDVRIHAEQRAPFGHELPQVGVRWNPITEERKVASIRIADAQT